MPPAAHVAERFAQALDHEEYHAASKLLADDCVYTCRGSTYRGPEAIIDSYRGHGDAASRDFDGIEYESRVEERADGMAVIEFVDQLTHRGKSHTFTSQQVIEVGDDGLIRRIEHVDLPGQREALETFLRECGVQG
ncbi:SnoaL-like domain protein [Maioricimonas rarisocia]|uniref:SnoaL-like domain protein n=1 Tax=Maioricimonas rarisocia TaxID=2528026 RepID=A0A517ZE78_9PLAN|nr:nuclear transport factor 2 family protein [Maioricimonas rarisocia]QDU40759.1 SnoaL-like domain protein [Maioricimonas rarisocia]